MRTSAMLEQASDRADCRDKIAACNRAFLAGVPADELNVGLAQIRDLREAELGNATKSESVQLFSPHTGRQCLQMSPKFTFRQHHYAWRH